MIDLLDVFAVMDRAMDARGYALESEQYTPQSFGYRTRMYRKDPDTALSLQWEARDSWLIVQGGTPWRDLAIYREARSGRDSPEDIVAALLREVDAAI